MPVNHEERLPILVHLDELRKRLLYSIIALFVAFLVAFQYSEILLNFLQLPLTFSFNIVRQSPYIQILTLPSPTKLIFTAPAEAFWMYMKIGFIGSVFLSLPFIIAQIWLFIAPGLKPKERKYALPFIIGATVMFCLGALFCQFVILPFALRFLLTYQTATLTPLISIGKYVDFVTSFMLAFGLIFELPLVITILSRIGLVTPQFLSRHRKWAILIAFIVAAILTPTPDMFNQCLMAVPILFLYEVGIIMARIFGRKKMVEASAAEEA
ncbi:MAG TPA: twin-arginine translocase subunit TatC [Nitrospirota bacterium]